MLFTILRPKCLIQREAKKGSGDNVPRLGDWGMKSPNVPISRSDQEKSSQGAKRYLTGAFLKARFDLTSRYEDVIRIEKRVL